MLGDCMDIPSPTSPWSDSADRSSPDGSASLGESIRFPANTFSMKDLLDRVEPDLRPTDDPDTDSKRVMLMVADEARGRGEVTRYLPEQKMAEVFEAFRQEFHRQRLTASWPIGESWNKHPPTKFSKPWDAPVNAKRP